MPRISILIPCLGDTLQFESTLASVLQNRPRDCEVLVSHNLAYHDPWQLGRDVCFVHAPEATNFAGLLNAGFEASRSPVVHVIQCGLEIVDDWLEPALLRFNDETVGMVAPVVHSATEKPRVQVVGWNLTSVGRCQLVAAGQRLSHVQQRPPRQLMAPTLAAGFYRRAMWRRLRFDTSLSDILAPLALGISARQCGWQTVCEPECLLYGDAPTLPRTDIPFNFHAARTAEKLFWREHPQPGWLQSLGHAGYVALETLAALPGPKSITALAGRCLSYFTRREAMAYRSQLASLAQEIQEAGKAAESAPAILPYVRIRDEKRSAAAAGKQRAA